jgi:hypothetical protein
MAPVSGPVSPNMTEVAATSRGIGLDKAEGRRPKPPRELSTLPTNRQGRNQQR